MGLEGAARVFFPPGPVGAVLLEAIEVSSQHHYSYYSVDSG